MAIKLGPERRAWRDKSLSTRVFVERQCKTAEELLGFLLPHTSDLLYGGANQDWLFRGQSDAVWGLTPSAMRKGELIKFTPGQLHVWDLKMDESMAREESVAHTFNSFAAGLGFEAPGDRPELRDHARRFLPKNRSGAQFPPVATRWFYALAQHYGIPTRLVDWTRSAMVAAYFAAIGAVKHEKENPGSALAVWALSENYVREKLSSAAATPAVSLVTAPTVSNPNLHAQSGVFTLVEYMKKPKHGRCWPLPDVDDLVAKRRYRSPKLPSLVKFTLPYGMEPRRLLHFLFLAQVHVATIFPSRESVKDLMLEGWHRSVARPGASL